jgi:UDP-glucose 4-epimerase
MEKALVTGGAGFIGSHLTTRLLKKGYEVLCIDDLSLGCKENIQAFESNANFSFNKDDVSLTDVLLKIIDDKKIDIVFHLAANSDIQASTIQPGIDYKKTFMTTYAVLECIRLRNIGKMFFASTSAIYGEKIGAALSETIGALFPISYYGGAKLASESFISAYAYMNDFDMTIFRFPNVIGPNLTHGVLFDFIKKLRQDSAKLDILGDGMQHKPYIYIDDLLDAIELVALSDERGVNIYNVDVEGTSSVREIADMVCKKLKLEGVRYCFSGGDRGWKGDVPTFQYDLTKIHKRGWKARYNSNQTVQATLDAVMTERSRRNT